MDNHSDNIDDAFKQRFDGLKDHSVDPGVAWSQFESSLSAHGAASVSSANRYSAAFKIAASVASLLMVGTIASDRNTSLKLDAFAGSPQVVQETRGQINELTDNSSSALAPSSSAPVFAAKESSTSDEKKLLAATQTTFSSNQAFEDIVAASTVEAFEAAAPSHEFMTARDAEVALMNPIELASDAQGIVLRQLESEDITIPSYYKNHRFYVRGGIRGGTGESNSSKVAANFNLNALISAGMAYSISTNTFMTAEVGVLRRSGNGIERSKDMDISSVYNVLNCSYENSTSDATPSRTPLKMQKSLIANQLDYLHMPVQMHVVLGPASNVSIGFYGEYLLQAKNESYLVYDGEDYVNTPLALGEASSKKGLNTMRVGIMAGVQHSITEKVSADVRGTLPISSIYDRSSEYSIQSEPNQLVDFQLSLVYKI